MEITVVYVDSITSVPLTVDSDNYTIWATRREIAELFACTEENVRQHIQNIYDTDEADPGATSKKILRVQKEGDREVNRHVDAYNLDLILSVGYRVSSSKATRFRKWATQTLSAYLRDGFVIDEKRLEDDPEANRKLAEKVREIRLSEQNQYQAIKDIFKESSSDYDPNSKAAALFFASVQNKFYYAITEQTAIQIKLSRSDKDHPMFGLVHVIGDSPTLEEAQVAKNYLSPDELALLQNVCHQWMLFAEGNAMRGKKMTMSELLYHVQDLLKFNGFHVLWDNPGGPTAPQAERQIKKEFGQYKKSIEQKEKTKELD